VVQQLLVGIRDVSFRLISSSESINARTAIPSSRNDADAMRMFSKSRTRATYLCVQTLDPPPREDLCERRWKRALA
jgi:hypothetical protein